MISVNEANQAVKSEEGRSFFSRLKKGLTKTQKILTMRVDDLVLGKTLIDEPLLEELEEILILADVGVHTTQYLMERIRARVKWKETEDPTRIRYYLKDEVAAILKPQESPLVLPKGQPFVIMVVGVNGTGKTTTIAKLGYQLKQNGKNVVLAAADTFRAGAIEQLEVWAARVDCDIIRQKSRSDPSAVAFDAVRALQARDMDVLLIDTAGRLHTKVNLMEELKKIRRVVGREMPGAPHETLLVMDATTGQNGIAQAKIFLEAVEVTGIALTKLDGTSKGGVIIPVSHELKIPLRYIGIGEKIDDLRVFSAQAFVDALF
jgi:fused signal recognition particle receptor